MIHSYDAPPGFCFDTLCTDDPINDNPSSKGYNKDKMVNKFIEVATQDFSRFKGPTSKHLLYPMGSDFHYQNANKNFKNLDKLIQYVNDKTAETGIEAFYSTPSCYLKGVYQDQQDIFPDHEWKEKTDDFFPYASSKDAYWTGYFTSRPTLKYMERQSNNLLQIAKQVATLYGNPLLTGDIVAEDYQLNALKRQMGAMQHHDAVTGTEKQNVAEDYALNLFEASKEAEALIGPLLYLKAGIDPENLSSDFLCPLSNISQCSLTDNIGNNMIILVYNPLVRPISKIIRFPVIETNIEISCGNGTSMALEFIPIPDFVKKIPGRDSKSKYDALFYADDIKPLGYKTFHIHRVQWTPKERVLKPKKLNNLPKNIIAKVGYYPSYDGSGQNSGAYIFRPNVTEKIMLDIKEVEFIDGELVKEYWVRTDKYWASFIQREYSIDENIEVEWLIGPIPQNGSGTEVVMAYSQGQTVSKKEKKDFWTDSNGRQMMYRKQDTRFSFRIYGSKKQQPISSNYYPITSGRFITLKAK